MPLLKSLTRNRNGPTLSPLLHHPSSQTVTVLGLKIPRVPVRVIKESGSRLLRPESSPQRTRQSPVTTLFEALPTGTVFMDKSGQHWKLGLLQNRITGAFSIKVSCHRRPGAGLGWAISEPVQEEGDPFLRMGMEAMYRTLMQTCLKATFS